MTKFTDSDIKCFAMLNVASAIKDSKYEGTNNLTTFEYYFKLLDSSKPAELGLTDDQLTTIKKEIQSLITFAKLYQSFQTKKIDNPSTIDFYPPNIDFDKLFAQINTACDANKGKCYLPSGWIGKPSGHFTALKVVKLADNKFQVSVINLGAGNQYHQPQAIHGERIKYDYESDVYEMDVSKQSGQAFFEGMVKLQVDRRILIEGHLTPYDATDLYGLMELYGKRIEAPKRSALHAKTRQRTGTCTITNTDGVAKDVLIEQFHVGKTALKRYSFLLKHKALEQAFAAYQNADDADKQAIYFVLKPAVEKQYVRIAKLHPEMLTDADADAGLKLCNTISEKIATDYQTRMTEISQEHKLPQLIADTWRDDAKIEIKKTETTITQEKKETPVAAKQSFIIQTQILPAELIGYLHKARNYFWDNNGTLALQQMRVFFRALPRTSGAEKDVFWDEVIKGKDITETKNKIFIIINDLVNLIKTASQFKSEEHKAYRFEIAAIVYDIAAQLVQHIPHLTGDGQFAFQLSDVCSEESFFEDPESYYTIKSIYENFARRGAGKKLIFSNNVNSDREDKTKEYIGKHLILPTRMAELKEKHKLENDDDVIRELLQGKINSDFLGEADPTSEKIFLHLLELSVMTHQLVPYYESEHPQYDVVKQLISPINMEKLRKKYNVNSDSGVKWALLNSAIDFSEIAEGLDQEAKDEFILQLRALSDVVKDMKNYESGQVGYPESLTAGKSKIDREKRIDEEIKNAYSTSDKLAKRFPDNRSHFTENTVFYPQTRLEDIRKDMSNNEKTREDFNPYYKSYSRSRHYELPYEVLDAGTFKVNNDYWEKSPDNASLDEDLRCIEASPYLQIERTLDWAINHIDQCLHPKIRHRIFSFLFQFGKMEYALKHEPNNVLTLTDKFIQRGLNYYLAKINAGDRGEALSAYTWLCAVQAYLRSHVEYAAKIHHINISAYRWHDTTSTLLELFDKEQNSVTKQELARAMVMTLSKQYGSQLPIDKLEIGLACYLYSFMEFMGHEKAHFSYCSRTLAEPAWSQQQDWFLQQLKKLDPGKLNQLANDLIKQTLGIETKCQWQMLGQVLKAIDGDYSLDLNMCQWSLQGRPLVNCNIIAQASPNREWLRRFGIDVDTVVFRLIDVIEEYGRQQFRMKTADGQYEFEFKKSGEQYELISAFRSLKIDNKYYRFSLASNPDDRKAPLNLGDRYKNDKLFTPENKDHSYWVSEDKTVCLFENRQQNYEGLYLSTNKARWVRLAGSAADGYHTTDTILFDVLKSDEKRPYTLNQIEEYWGNLIRPIAGQRDALIRASVKGANAQVIDIRLPVLNLDFIVNDNKLFCQQFPGYYLSGQQSLAELNGLDSLIILKNAKGQTKYLLPNYQFKKVEKNQALTREEFLERGKLNRGPAYYELFLDKNNQLSVTDPTGWFYLTMIYRAQGDYERALQYLRRTEHHTTNTVEMAELYDTLLKYRDDSAVGVAFECKVIVRMLWHRDKWSKNPDAWYANLNKDEFVKHLEEILQFYKDNLSAVKQGISMIPKDLLLSAEEIALLKTELTLGKKISEKADETEKTSPTQREVLSSERLKKLSDLRELKQTIFSRDITHFIQPLRLQDEADYQEGEKWQEILDESYHALKSMPYFIRFFRRDVFLGSESHDALAFMKRYFVDLFKLAISDNVEDQKLLKAQVFFLLNNNVVERSDLSQLIQLLHLVALHQSKFKNLTFADSKQLLEQIFARIKQEFTAETFPEKLPPLISGDYSPQKLAKHQTVEYPLTPVKITSMPGNSIPSSFEMDKRFQNPLSDLVGTWFIETHIPIAEGDFPLSIAGLSDPTPLERALLERYQEGHEKNKTKKKIYYRIREGEVVSDRNDKKFFLNNLSILDPAVKPRDDGAGLQQAHNVTLENLITAVDKKQQENTDRAKQCFDDLMIITKKVPSEEDKKYKAFISARGGLQINPISLADCYNVLLTGDVTILTSRNPFLTQDDINNIIKKTREYALCQISIAQCHEALNIIGNKKASKDLSADDVQLLGSQLAKSRHYDEREFPEFLIYEAATGRMLRDDQVKSLEDLIRYIENDSSDDYRSTLLQFAAGGGKTSVMIPLLAKRFAKQGFLPVIFNTNELYYKGIKDIPESLQACFGQLVEVIERELEHQWSADELARLLKDLERWKAEGRTLLLKPVTWHSIHLTYKMAIADKEKSALASHAFSVLEFFHTACIKLEDESHITSDPLQQSIKTYGPMQVIPRNQQALMMRFYDLLMGREKDCELLAKKAGIIDKSKHSVPENVIKEIQQELAEKISRDLVIGNITDKDIKAYLVDESRKRPQWLRDLHTSQLNKAELIVLARAYIQTVLPYILTMQLKKDYGHSIHAGDLTAAPKHDEEDVSSHFGDRLVLMALTIQLYQQEGVPSESIRKIIHDFQAQHMQERYIDKQGVTEAALNLRQCLPEAYANLRLDGLSNEAIDKICNSQDVCHYLPMIQHFLYQYALAQILVPKFRATSTAADLHAGFPKGSICFSATPGLIETYPAYLSKRHCYLATDFEAEVIAKLLQKENLQVVQIDMTHSPSEFFRNLQKENPEVLGLLGTLIDRGALLSGSNPKQVVEAYLEHVPDKVLAATAHFVEEQLVLTSHTADIAKIKIDGTQLLKSLEQHNIDPSQYLLLLYLELSRATGTDVKRPYRDVAGLTIGKEQTMTEVIQAAMRERQLLWKDAQTITWILFKSPYQTIVPESKTFDLKQVFYWMIRNEAKKNHHKIMARAYQGIEHEIEAVIWDKIRNGTDYNKYAANLEKTTDISIYDHYELAAVLDDTGKILNQYIDDYCAKFHLDRKSLQPQTESRLKVIVEDTKHLIAETYAPQSADIHVEVVQEQQQEQQTQAEQQTQQQTRRMDNLSWDFKFASEQYEAQDHLDSVFDAKHYQPVSFENLSLKFPPLRLCVTHFCPYEGQYKRDEIKFIKYLKPIHVLLTRIDADGHIDFIALTAAGAEHFSKQINSISKDDKGAKYALISSAGHVLQSSANLIDSDRQRLLQSVELEEILTFTDLLNGQVRPHSLSAMVHKYGWSEKEFRSLLDNIRSCSVTHHPFDIDDFIIKRIYQVQTRQTFQPPKEESISGQSIVVPADPLSNRVSVVDTQREIAQPDPLGYLADPTKSESMMTERVIGETNKFTSNFFSSSSANQGQETPQATTASSSTTPASQL